MNSPLPLESALALLPAALMILSVLVVPFFRKGFRTGWSFLIALSAVASAAALASLVFQLSPAARSAGSLPGLMTGDLMAWIALLVQAIGTVILGFSSRYIDGEKNQAGYAAAMCAVLAAVQILVLADHWGVLIVAWAATGLALNRLLCFYGDRPFAALAAHKKAVADRLADVLLIAAAWLAVRDSGTASISGLLAHVETVGAGAGLQAAAILVAVAVIIRTALLPVHGWLIQVMEAPTPVSALLHAGVVNLGGYILIRFAPLLEAAPAARLLLVGMGLATAMLAGFVMLTRISIKVRLAWSTLAQMGFMVLECGLGLYQLAVLHLIGHSLYKAHAFLSSGDAVRQARLRDMHETWRPSKGSLLMAPVLGVAVIASLTHLFPSGNHAAWPWWWSGVLAFAWAPMLWSRDSASPRVPGRPVLRGALLVGSLTAFALLGHALPLGVSTSVHDAAGMIALAGIALLYTGTAALQRPASSEKLETFRRRCYAGFYLDETYTRLVLYLWPVRLPLPRTGHV